MTIPSVPAIASAPALRLLFREVGQRPLIALGCLLDAVTILFLSAPEIDLGVSHWFYSAGSGFSWRREPLFEVARTLSGYITAGVICFAVAARCAPRLLGRRLLGVGPGDAAYVIAVYPIGPGLVVNELFKNVFGRPRPRELIEFGGKLDFTNIWTVAGQCVGNCSFISGEAAAAAALLTLAVIAPAKHRPLALAILLPIATTISFNRIAYGGHFLSDVVIAWIITLLIAFFIRPFFMEGNPVDLAKLVGRRLPLAAKAD
jgi:membrane-associated phospholipid phosphatase